MVKAASHFAWSRFARNGSGRDAIDRSNYGMRKATATVPFPYVGSPGCNYEQLFLDGKAASRAVFYPTIRK